MYTLRRLLLTVTFCCFAATAMAQTDVTVELVGIDGELADNARLFLAIEQQRGNPLLSEARLKRLHQKATQEIAAALQPFGYYRPKINAQLIQNAPDQWLARYTVDRGPAIPLSKFDFSITGEMSSDSAFKKLWQTMPLIKGEAFSHKQYEAVKSSLAKLAAERGYFDARFVVHRVEIDLNNYEARVTLHYDSGPRYHFGDIAMHQEVLDPKLLNRFIPFEQSAPYTLDDLIELQQALNDSDYFRVVEVTPAALDSTNHRVPINVLLTPRKRHRFIFGPGYGTDTGARVKFGWEMPRLNQRGHRFDTELKVSEIGYSVSARYRVPVLNPRTDQIIYSAGIVNETTDTSESTVRTFGASLSRNRGAWRETTSLNYQQEEYRVGNDDGLSTLLIPGISWNRTWGRKLIHVFDGLRFDFEVRGANEHVISDTDFVQVDGGLKGITPITPHNRLITRGRLGGTYTDKFHQLPSSVRFFAGGSQSVRGYGYQTLGPRNASGDVEGGKYLMVGSVEWEHSFDKQWGVALFYDGGNAINDIEDTLERGAGFGIRWRSPIGPVRFDLASAVTRDGHPWRLHINIGPDL